MTPLVWANFPLMFLVAAAIIGIPMWMIFKRPDRAPDHSEAHAYLRAKASAEPSAGLADLAPAQLTAMATAAAPPSPRQGRWHTAGPRGLVPGRRHSGRDRGTRIHLREPATARNQTRSGA